MEPHLPWRHLLFILPFTIFQNHAYKNENFDQVNEIKNFRAVNVSNSELRITVDYTYNGQAGDNNVAILTGISDSTGAGHERDVIDAEMPLLRGTHTVTLIVKMRSSGLMFTSSSVRVCMATADTAILCKDFQYVKKWSKIAVTVTPNGTITGRVTGTLSYRTRDQPDGPITVVKLTHITIEGPDGKIENARIDSRGNYSIKVASGKTYKVYPMNFRSTRGVQTVRCRANTRHHVNFTITGPPRGD